MRNGQYFAEVRKYPAEPGEKNLIHVQEVKKPPPSVKKKEGRRKQGISKVH